VKVMAKLAATQAEKVGFRAVRAGAVYTRAFLMNSSHRKWNLPDQNDIAGRIS